jgi:hypothetical protein
MNVRFHFRSKRTSCERGDLVQESASFPPAQVAAEHVPLSRSPTLSIKLDGHFEKFLKFYKG